MKKLFYFFIASCVFSSVLAQTDEKLPESRPDFQLLPDVLFEGDLAGDFQQGNTLSFPTLDLSRGFTFLIDEGATYPMGDSIREGVLKNNFRPYDPEKQVLDAKIVYWFRINLRNESPRQRNLILQCDSHWDKIDLYVMRDTKQIAHYQSGQKIAPTSKQLIYPMGKNAFQLSFDGQERLDIFFRVDQRDWIGSGWQEVSRFKIRMFNWDFARQDLDEMHRIDLLYLWVFLAFSFYHLLLFLSSREREYLFYALSIACITLWNATDRLLLYEYLSGFWAYTVVKPLAIAGAAFFLMRFTDIFLNLKTHRLYAHKLLWKGQWLLLFIPLYVFLKEIWRPAFLRNHAETIKSLFETYEILMACFYLGLIIWVSWKMSRQGYPPARFYFYSFTMYFLLVLGVYLFLFLSRESWIDVSLLKISAYLNHFNIGANALILFVFSIAIGDKMNRLQKDKLEIAQKNLYLQQNANQILEKTVNERTAQLKKANQSLKDQNIRLEDLNEELSTLNDEKDNLIRIVAHNLGTPLAANNMYLGLLRKHGHNLNEDQQEYLSTIAESNQNLIRMINRILDVSVIEINRIHLQPEDVEVATALNETIKKLNSIAERKNITILTNYEVSPATIRVDRSYFDQIVENLLGNAIKFSEYHKKIYIRTFLTDDWLKISIRDEGPGIKEEDRKKMFKIYQMLSARPTAGENSTGLGLYIVKKYTEAMGGRVTEEGLENQGANFILHFKKIPLEEV